jgi:NADH-quinone oxidoreductase subunit J
MALSETLIFWGLASLVLLCSGIVVTARNPVTSAAFLIVDFFVLAGIYAMQGADFVAAIQVIVYTGAVVVLFLFVIMILNLAPDHDGGWHLNKLEFGALLLTVTSFGYLLYQLFIARIPTPEMVPATDPRNTEAVARVLFFKYVWPFEIVSLLILLAIVGSISIARRPKSSVKKELHHES